MKISLGKRSFEARRVFCIGRNYYDHIKELHDEVPEKPVIFMKPETSLVLEGEQIKFPLHGRDFQYETELVILIGKEGRPDTAKKAMEYIAGISLGFDLTMRDVQRYLLPKGLPWELSKSFDQSAPLGRFVEKERIKDLNAIEFFGKVNGEVKQHGLSKNMINGFDVLVFEISRAWKLLPGDLIYTGTPSGIGPLKHGDQIIAESAQIGSFSWKLV
jgi:5-carboxymethyl-2-hydroxymuconate isomerase